MKRVFIGLVLALGVARAGAAPEKISFDISALDTTLPVQLCDRTETDVQDPNGNGWITVVKLSPSNMAVRDTDVVWRDGKPFGELFISTPADTESAGTKILLHMGARVGGQAFRGLWITHYEDGRTAIMLSDPDARTLAILRGETPDAPVGHNLKIEFSPSGDAPNQLKLRVSNTGQTPMTLRWGNDGTPDNPASDPLLSLSAAQGNKPVPSNPLPLPPGALGSLFTLQPGQSRERLIYLDDYLAFASSGTYQVSAHYTVQVQNPDPKNGPPGWNIGADAQFEVPVVHEAK